VIGLDTANVAHRDPFRPRHWLSLVRPPPPTQKSPPFRKRREVFGNYTSARGPSTLPAGKRSTVWTVLIKLAVFGLILKRAGLCGAMIGRTVSRPGRGDPTRLPVTGNTMFTSIRKYKVKRGSVEEFARRVEEGFLPLLRQMPGFRSYYLLDGGPDLLITISRFDSADEAFASNEKAANWVRNNVLEFTKGMPEVMVGQTLIAEVR
jgi:heme-degrading monooxygenase HmoA